MQSIFEHGDMAGYNPRFWKRNKPQLQTDFLVREKIPGILSPLTEKRVLDAGCGEGYLARKLAAQGAIVSAFDISSEMIRFAQEAENPHHIKYIVSDFSTLEQHYLKYSFDIAMLCGVISSFSEEELFKNLSALTHLIVDDGVICIATQHMDAFESKAQSRWIEYKSETNGEDTQAVVLRFNTYNGDPLFDGSCFIHSERRIRDAMAAAGFRLDKTIAPLATRQDMLQFSHMWGDEAATPYHLILVGCKI